MIISYTKPILVAMRRATLAHYINNMGSYICVSSGLSVLQEQEFCFIYPCIVSE